ncbi:putative low-temperature-induced 65 kDa protein [Sesbania bispinosa]|nr:putative low-temperature-induced 65 kDa protein [Sesbania bispinosa]
MDSRVVPSQVHENDELHPHNVDSQQVTHGAEEHHSDFEKKSVLNKVKAKAKKIKDTIKKHGQHVLDHGHDNNNEDQHIPHDHDLDEDKDPDVHGSPINESEAVKSATSKQVENLEKSTMNFGGTMVMEEEPHQEPLVVGVSSTTEMNQNIATDTAKTFGGEEKPGQCEVNLERPIGLEEDPQAQESRHEAEAYTPPSYQTKVTDPSGAGSDEIKDITQVEETFGKMNIHNEPKPTPEPKVQSTVVDIEYPSAESHDQFVPHLSAATKTQNEYPLETISPNINRNPEILPATEETFNTTTTEEQPHYESVETQPNQNSYTDIISCDESADKTVSPENAEASKLDYDEKGERNNKVTIHEEQQKSGDASNMSGSTLEYGKNIAHSLTEKLAPVYGKVAEVGSVVKSKVYGTSTDGVGTETKIGVSVKDYLAEKLKPGEEDKALSEVISEALHKRKEEHEQLGSGDEKSEKVCEESYVNSPGKGVVDKVKGVVGSWFAKSGENQSTQGGEDLSKDKNSGGEVEQVSQVVVGERRTQE